MKSTQFVFLLLISVQVFSQATKQKATLTFKDGKELSCYARISGENIRYADIKNTSKEIIADEKNLKSIKIWMNDNLIELYYKTEVKKIKAKLMELVIKDKMKLYRIADVYQKSIGFSSNDDYFSKKTASTVYFLESKINPDEVIRVGANFEEMIKDYFSDCKLLTEQIGNDDFRKKDIFKIVIYYNENCGVR